MLMRSMGSILVQEDPHATKQLSSRARLLVRLLEPGTTMAEPPHHSHGSSPLELELCNKGSRHNEPPVLCNEQQPPPSTTRGKPERTKTQVAALHK